MRQRIAGMAGALLLLSLLLVSGSTASAYSVLTHEQVIDFVWEHDIKPVLLQRYPSATAEDLKKAHAFAYGGSLIQDMGYYPSENKVFSDLVHYVRSGDFVAEMIRDARDLNELAFALGALAHYVSDNTGHPFVNRAVSISFPKLGRKYGKEVTYEEDPKAHIRTEFGFDVLQVAQRHYASQSFHDFIGFEVARPLLERAFLHTYGIELRELLPDEERAIGDYRHALSVWIPRFTEVALITKKKELEATPDFNPKKFRYIMRRSEYEKEWGKNYDRPGFFARFLAVVVRILPKVGPLKTLDVKVPDRQTEKIFIGSVEQTVTEYHVVLTRLGAADLKRLVETDPKLVNFDLDTGQATAPAEYALADKTYARLLKMLAQGSYNNVSPALRANVLEFYRDLQRPLETKRHKDQWNALQRELDGLRKQTSPALQGEF
jgi:hypothetical protein